MSLGKKRNAAAFSGKKKKPQAEQKKQPPIQPSTAPAAPDSENSKENSALNRPVDFAGANRAHALFFTPEAGGKDFSTVLAEVQAYISGHYSTLLTTGGGDAKTQMKRYIQKFLQDNRVSVNGMSGGRLADALYTEMAEFGFLTKYIFGTGIEEIDINSWRDIEVQYSDGRTVKLEERFESPQHAVNVIRRMLHISGMVLDNASPIVLGHLSKNIRIAVLKSPIVDEDVGVAASIRIVNPQSMKKEDFVRSGTATDPNGFRTYENRGHLKTRLDLLESDIMSLRGFDRVVTASEKKKLAECYEHIAAHGLKGVILLDKHQQKMEQRQRQALTMA